jgi:hypothetical protein
LLKTLHKKYFELAGKLNIDFYHFTHDWDLNVNRFPNSLVQFGQQNKEVFGGANSIYPNDSVQVPSKNNKGAAHVPLIEYHPVQLDYRNRLDFLFNF